MKNLRIIKKNYQFQEIINSKNSLKSSSFVIYFQTNKINKLCYGISVGKKNWKAYQRNKIKRQIRMMVWEYIKKFENHSHDIIIIIKKKYDDYDFKGNAEQLYYLMNKLRFKNV